MSRFNYKEDEDALTGVIVCCVLGLALDLRGLVLSSPLSASHPSHFLPHACDACKTCCGDVSYDGPP